MDPKTERALVGGIQRGEGAAFAQAYEAYRARLHNFLLRMTNQPAVAEELLQETWMRLARNGPRLAEDTELGAWLYTVARNLARDHARSERGAPRRSPASALDGLPDASASPEVWAVATEAEGRLSRALGELSEGDREVVLLVCVEGMPQEVVARVLDLTHDAVRQRLARARARLSRALQEEPLREARTRRQEEHADHART